MKKSSETENFQNDLDKKKKKARKKTHFTEAAIAVGMITMVLLTIYCVFNFRAQIFASGINTIVHPKKYEKHFVLITDEQEDPLWDSIYQGVKKEGKKYDICVEYLGKSLPTDYSVHELFRIAIDADVDGIIVIGDESEETVKLINEAVEKEIPVVTVLNDSTASLRQCFIGVSNYNMGQEYGRQALKLLRNKLGQSVCVLMDSGNGDTSKNTTFLGIKETIAAKYPDIDTVKIQALAVDDKNSFTSEETIRDLMLDEDNLPDILICLSAVDTRCAFQAAVDYNKVGKIEILGYYASDAIMEAIKKDIIYSTISIDGVQMGTLCINALQEYEETGYVSGYFPVDTKLITGENVNYYIEQSKQED